MDWLDEVSEREHRGNQILFRKDSILLQELNKCLREQNHRTVVLWAMALAEEAVRRLEEERPEEARPRLALEAGRQWAAGKIKMPRAQRCILDCHAAAKAMPTAAGAALCHAVGQACGTVHTPGHAIGFPMYELTAIVRVCGVEHCREPVEARAAEYLQRLTDWSSRITRGEDSGYEWAAFLQP